MSKIKSFIISKLSKKEEEIWNTLDDEEPIVAVLLSKNFIDVCIKTLLEHKFRRGSTSKRLLEKATASIYGWIL